MPTIDFSRVLRSLNNSTDMTREELTEVPVVEKGEPVLDEQGNPKMEQRKVNVPATLKYVCVSALLTPCIREERREDGLIPADHQVKLRRYFLAQKIENSKEPIKLTNEEIVEIKKLIGYSAAFTVLSGGQAISMLDE